MKTKWCGRCKADLPLTYFAKNSAKKDGLQERCTPCRNEHYNKNRADISERRRASYCTDTSWERKIQYAYNLTKEDFLKMLDSQGNVCAICRSDDWGCGKKTTRPHVDHNHETGKVRGLLCNNCNRSLGLLKDNADVLKSAVKYLEDNNET